MADDIPLSSFPPKLQPQVPLGTIAKAGQTVDPTDIYGQMQAMPGQAASAVGNVLGVNDAMKALRGEQTPDEAQMFALGALPALIGGPEAKAAEEAVPLASKAIRAFHGSPYDFNQFDMSKIGTGEGAQAYGHGLYFAENPLTAAEYRNKPLLPVTQVPRGKSYEVNINADPDHFLDWDKPLSEQHPLVQNAVRSLPGFDDESLAKYTAGKNVEAIAGDNPAAASQALRDAGIPGIKYLDQGSRIGGDAGKMIDNYGSREKALDIAQQRLQSAGMGDLRYWDNVVNQLKNPQTSNYVVFNDKLIDIIKKYGLAGMLGGGGAAAMTQQQPPLSSLQQ